jgi:acetyltransferase
MTYMIFPGVSGRVALVVFNQKSAISNQQFSAAMPNYPAQYIEPFTLRNGLTVLIRPIRRGDESLLARFHETLSDRSIHQRYFNLMKLSTRVDAQRLIERCTVDYLHDMALVALLNQPDAQGRMQEQMIAVGRFSHTDGDDAEYALLISDAHQHQGLGGELLRRLIVIARASGLKRLTAQILDDNLAMQRASRRHGFTLTRDEAEGGYRAVLVL